MIAIRRLMAAVVMPVLVPVMALFALLTLLAPVLVLVLALSAFFGGGVGRLCALDGLRGVGHGADRERG